MALEKLWAQIMLTLPNLQSLPRLFSEPACGPGKTDKLGVEALK